ncbi:hydroxyacylglutathione hydrolase [Melghiribacillus thermohalophilus]|uniref:Hydroxyacylglutathione hydrolase n=1 Tax=Melghiribacillus thermohalophilus TaxID=1324956 RepID=A0A4R3N8K3_9BACI|nr:rhodanese-like domain-containing protein [Melghiribacillus thermohalophilus]TCT24556.1 hydroxyacylglutathione hydrolase [Melghiribacillus thermohalophilus]
MFLRYFYDEKLAHASYLVGCQKTGEAIVVDPSRDIEQYVEEAEKEGLNVTAACETHIHADFVSGARELADRFDAKLYLSDEGNEDWKYENLDGIRYQLLKDGDTFKIGNLTFEVLHTPGHTPESISFLLTDNGGGADRPMGIFTGDFVFVGDVGRPDLLEKAAGHVGTADEGAKQMFQSLERFKQLPDFLQVWPAHGAGSACGKSLGAVPSSTVGYEKMFNWALQYDNENEFVEALLDGQPEPPKYFAVMKRVNKVGIELLKNLDLPVKETDSAKLQNWIKEGMVIDTRSVEQFAKGHVPGTINIPFDQSFTNWAGWLVDYEAPLYLIVDESQMRDAIKALRSIGIDNTRGYMEVKTALDSVDELERYAEVEPKEIKEQIEKGEVYVLDVRNLTEFKEGHIPGASHIMLGTLPERLNEVPQDKQIVLNCGTGKRSAIGASVLQANGIKDIVNLVGGFERWVDETQIVTK